MTPSPPRVASLCHLYRSSQKPSANAIPARCDAAAAALALALLLPVSGPGRGALGVTWSTIVLLLALGTLDSRQRTRPHAECYALPNAGSSVPAMLTVHSRAPYSGGRAAGTELTLDEVSAQEAGAEAVRVR